MKTVKNYGNFSEDYRLNENLLKKAWGAIFKFFQGKYKIGAWLFYALWLKKTGQLPKEKVEIYSPADYDVPSTKEVEMATESKMVTIGLTMINEEIVTLDHTDPNIRNVDVAELGEIITDIYNMNLDRVEEGRKRTKNDALFIWGAPGIGKTEILNQVADKLGCVVIEFHLATIEPTDFRGVPKVENIKGSDNPLDERTVSKIPAIFPTDDGLNNTGGIMFFDELNRAKQMVLSAALPLALNGKVGTYELPPRWIVVAAGNRPEDIGGVATAIEPALGNRFAHVNYSPTLPSWIDWAIKKKDINPDLIAFLQFNKQYFHKLDNEKETPNWPSPRTWEMASHKEFFKRGKNWANTMPLDRIQDIYTDLVGREAAVSFISYLKLKAYYNEKDVADVYTKGKAAKKPPKQLDQARAASASIAYFKKGEELTVKELTNVLDWALDLPDMESKTSMLSFFKQAHPEVKEKEPWKTIWWDYIKKWHIGLKEIS